MVFVWQNSDSNARLLRREDVVAPQEVTLADAQPFMNFVVFQPTILPSDCAISSISMRPEQPPGRPDGISAAEIGQTPWSNANPSSIRIVISGNGRRVRLKQFLYDWAPPAAGIAPLDGPASEPHRCGDVVVWLGVDFKGNRGGCCQRMRSQIELSVTLGVFSDEELIEIFKGLEPVSHAMATIVAATPFHLLNYWCRYRFPSTGVPHGLWKYHNRHHYEHALPGSIAEAQARAKIVCRLPTEELFEVDSAASIVDAPANYRAVEVILRNRKNRSDHLWILAIGADCHDAPEIPPTADSYPAQVRTKITLGSVDVWYAAFDRQFGAWEAFWQDEDIRYCVWAGPSLFLTSDEFLETIRGMTDSDSISAFA